VSTRNLDALFAPGSIALIGASNQPGSVGSVLAENLLESGFRGPVTPVNPHEAAIRSTPCYRSVADLPSPPDLAVIATPAPTVPGLIADLGARGCRAAVVISAGFGEAGGDGGDLKEAMLAAARPHLLRIVGPNCLGVMSPGAGLNATFARTRPAAGPLALVAQSGAVAAAALDWASARGHGFSRVVTLGDMADVDFGDVLDFLALDDETKAVVLYVESITAARKFMSAARMAGRNKPVAVIKAGRSAAGARAALSHTGALAGADGVYDAAFRRAGLLRVYELRELFDAVTTLTSGISVRGDRLAVVTNGGGAGVMAVDALEERGGHIAALSPQTLAALDACLPRAWSKGDPVDILGDAQPARYRAALQAVLADRGADAVLVLNCPTAVADSTDAARAVVETVHAHKPRRAVLTSWLGETAAAGGRRLFAEASIPTHETPDEAVRAFMHLAEHARNRALLLQAPAATPETPPDRPAAQAVIERALAEGRSMLTDPEAKAVLKAYGVPVVESREAATPAEAGEIAAALGGAVALKILSPDVTHKSDVGGVVLGLVGARDVAVAAEAMAARVAEARPEARLSGFMVQPMVNRPGARELIAGVSIDRTFGPVVLFGAGGTAVEVLADSTVGLPPLNEHLARDMIARTRVAKLLDAYRGLPAANVGAIAQVLIALARLAVDLPDVAELDINPLLADADGVIALDSRIRVAKAADRPAPAIRPYPDGLAREAAVAGERVVMRPIRPTDAAGLIDLVERCDADDVRLRFGGGLRHLPQSWAGRLSQIDYDREMALVAEGPNGDILGVARLAADPEGHEAEFAVMVRSDHQRRGLAHLLMSDLIAYARSRGLKRLWGQVARENSRMLEVAASLGFRAQPTVDLAYVRSVLDLATQEEAAGAAAPAA
jgi:acetyltransferase